MLKQPKASFVVVVFVFVFLFFSLSKLDYCNILYLAADFTFTVGYINFTTLQPILLWESLCVGGGGVEEVCVCVGVGRCGCGLREIHYSMHDDYIIIIVAVLIISIC